MLTETSYLADYEVSVHLTLTLIKNRQNKTEKWKVCTYSNQEGQNQDGTNDGQNLCGDRHVFVMVAIIVIMRTMLEKFFGFFVILLSLAGRHLAPVDDETRGKDEGEGCQVDEGSEADKGFGLAMGLALSTGDDQKDAQDEGDGRSDEGRDGKTV